MNPVFYPSENEFLKLTKKGNLIPVYCEIFGDLDTPVSAYFKIAKDAPYSFLLESVEGEEKIARYSFLAKDPEVTLRTKDEIIEISHVENGKRSKNIQRIEGSPLDYVRKILNRYKFVNLPGLPRFCGGLVGYMGYDVIRFFEKIPQKAADNLHLPDMLLMLAKDLIIFDHLNHKIKIVSCTHINPKSSQQEKLKNYRKSIKQIQKLIKELNQPLSPEKFNKKINNKNPLKIKSNFKKHEFEKIVQKAKEYIYQGETIQIVLSQRFETQIHTDPFNIYRALRALNPSPYMYFLNYDRIQIVGSSPELLVRCEDGLVETRPIAGTRPRGKDEQEDQKLSKELLNDPKERAEHIMLVDLGRNDLGRVCKNGSVKLSEFMKIEKYSHVMHIVSNVQGKLKKGKDAMDVLKAAFPAGTVTGAPKIRAMELIDELEPVARGPYAGCIGYFSLSGNLDTCITIRTIIIRKNTAYIQAGAGIVADSDPEKEYFETINKAKGPIKAIKLAHNK